MWRLNVNLNVIALCLMGGIFTKCDGYHTQRTFLGVQHVGLVQFFSGGEWDRKISVEIFFSFFLG